MRRVTNIGRQIHSALSATIGAVIVLVLATSADPAQAKVSPGSLPELIVGGKAMTFPIPVERKGVTFLYFSEPVVEIKRSNKNFDYVYLPDDHVVIVTPRQMSKRKRRAAHNHGVITCYTKGFNTHLKLSVATEVDWTEPAYAVKHLTEKQAEEAKIEAEVQRRTILVEDLAPAQHVRVVLQIPNAIDGNEMSGPDLAFDAKVYVSFGAGFDLQLGERWSIGWVASFAQSIDISSVTTGLHISYGWRPGGRQP